MSQPLDGDWAARGGHAKRGFGDQTRGCMCTVAHVYLAVGLGGGAEWAWGTGLLIKDQIPTSSPPITS